MKINTMTTYSMKMNQSLQASSKVSFGEIEEEIGSCFSPEELRKIEVIKKYNSHKNLLNKMYPNPTRTYWREYLELCDKEQKELSEIGNKD